MRHFNGALVHLILLSGFTLGSPLYAQHLYHAAYGEPTDPAVIFLHGGPGYNSASFELGAAPALAEQGYYVITYDRRGCARTTGFYAAYTFDEAIADLADVMDTYDVDRATLMGHSFGGAVATRFAQVHPRRVERIILVGAPLNYPTTFETIRRACREYYASKQDTTNLQYMDLLDAMDPATLNYAIYCFAHAMSCGLYQPAVADSLAKVIYLGLQADPQSKYLAISTQGPVQGFYKAHQYTTMDITSDVNALTASIPVYGIYGLEDGLFDHASRTAIAKTIGTDHMFVVKGASHSVFIDKQIEFFEAMNQIFTE